MTLSDQLLQRSDIIGTQVITRDTGKKLGVINQLWVDIDQQEVVAVGLKNTLFTGEQRYMYLNNVRQIGDVILVEDEDAIEDIDALKYSSLIDNEVITETGELLGKVRGFKFDINNGRVTDLVIASFGLPWIPTQLISTYELPVDEIVSTGPERLIVFEGAEERLNQLSVGVLERLGIGAPPWEQLEEDYAPPVTSTTNQLGSGVRSQPYQPSRRAPVEETWDEPPVRRSIPARQETWEEEEDWQQPVARQQPKRRYAPEPEPVYDEYDDYEDEAENWDDEPVEPARESKYEDLKEDLKEDPWADGDDNYEAPQINLPQKRKVAEYEPEEY
ncbi:MAG: PRC-barrel domain-containing protein [Aphanocapsa sp. GSE-SYN-MK-11-07L]|jgi:sporulation protein YlmC with PRC-barrel domain|nr:PRC-barrel domain-containing protein [Aphanocapsa sp. GSE-SYN-MK-11-07L]